MASRTKNLLSSLSWNTLYLSIISSIGIFLSLYALYVEIKFENDSSYRALCDINKLISCTSVFSSKYGKGLGLLPANSPFNLPNSVYGMGLYLLQLMLSNLAHSNVFLTRVHILNSMISNLSSVYLAYILVFKLRELCLVCVSTYIVNFVMLLLGMKRLKITKQLKSVSKKKD